MTTRPRRRWFPRSFSLRTLLLVVAATALGIALWRPLSAWLSQYELDPRTPVEQRVKALNELRDSVSKGVKPTPSMHSALHRIVSESDFRVVTPAYDILLLLKENPQVNLDHLARSISNKNSSDHRDAIYFAGTCNTHDDRVALALRGTMNDPAEDAFTRCEVLRSIAVVEQGNRRHAFAVLSAVSKHDGLRARMGGAGDRALECMCGPDYLPGLLQVLPDKQNPTDVRIGVACILDMLLFDVASHGETRQITRPVLLVARDQGPTVLCAVLEDEDSPPLLRAECAAALRSAMLDKETRARIRPIMQRLADDADSQISEAAMEGMKLFQRIYRSEVNEAAQRQ